MKRSIDPFRRPFRFAAGAVCALVISGCGPSRVHPAGSDDAPKAEVYFKNPDVRSLANAAKREDISAIDKLVAKGVDVNARGAYGVTPLLFAIERKKKAAFKRLLEHGADPNIQDEVGDSPMSAAAGDAESSEWLELVLKHKGNPNLVDPKGVFAFEDGRTPLFMAIDALNLRNIDLLLAAGANLDHQDKGGKTPAMVAATISCYAGVYRLLNAGANVHVRNGYGHDLAFNCFLRTINQKDFPEAYVYRQRVLAILKAKGVNLAEAKRLAEKHMGRKEGDTT